MPQQFPQFDKAQLIQSAEERNGRLIHQSTILDQALDQLIDALNHEAHLNDLGHQLMLNRFNHILDIQSLLQKELPPPEPTSISSRQSPQHLFILGLPRSGTTLLQHLLSLDPNAHYLPLHDCQFPVPASHPHRNQEKIAQSEAMTQKAHALFPTLPQVHYMHPLRADECYWLFEYQLLDIIFHLRMNVPSYYRWLLSTPDHTESYRHYRHLLDYMGQHYTFKHWLLKAPRHLFFLRSLLDVFPNAHIVWLHRDPVESIPSLCSLSHLLRSAYSDQENIQEIGTTWNEIMQERLRKALEIRKAVEDTCKTQNTQSPFYDLQYTKLIHQPIQAIQSLYEYFSLPFSSTLAERVTQWLIDNPQHKHGKHEYSAQNFGLDSNQIRQQFSFYTECFDMPRNH